MVVALGARRADVFDGEHRDHDDCGGEEGRENDEHGEHTCRGGDEEWIVCAQQC